MNLLFIQNVYLSFCLVAFFISSSEGKYLQMDTVSNEMEGKYEGQGNDSHNEAFASRFVETPVGNIVRRSAGSLKIYQALYTEKSPQGRVIIVYVDSTMTKLVFQASVERSNPVILTTGPLGIPLRTFPVLNGSASAGTVVATIEVNITTADYGIWKFMKMDISTWQVSITGESTVDFSYEIIDNSTGAAINDYPIQEKSYSIAIKVPNFAQLKTVYMGMLFSKDTSKPLHMSPLVNKGNGKYEFQDFIKMINKTFLIGIHGADNTGHAVRRLSPITVEPVSLKLIVPPYTGAKLHENETLDINFTVANVVSFEQDIDVRIIDDKGFALIPRVLTATLKPGESFTGYFTLKGGNYNGEVVKVSITARQYLGHGHSGPGPSVVRMLTVERSDSTTDSGSTTTTTVASTRSTVVKSTSTSPYSSTEAYPSKALTSLAISASTSRPVTTSLQNVTPTSLPGLIQPSGLVTNKILVTNIPQPLDTNDTGVVGDQKPITKVSPQVIQTNLTTATESPLMSSLKPQSVTTTEGNPTVATVFTSAANGNNIFNSNTSVAISASTSSLVPTSSQDVTSTTPPGLIQISGLETYKQLFLNTNDTGALGAQEPITSFSPQGKQTNLTTATESPLMSSSKPHSVSTIQEKPTLETVLATGAEGNQDVHIGKLGASEKKKQRHASQTMILIKILQGGCAQVDFEDSEEN